MDNNNQAVETLSKQIIKAIRKICNTLPFDRTVEGKIVSKTSTGYVVSVEGSQINVKGNGLYDVNDIVRIHIPRNNTNKAYVDESDKAFNQLNNFYTMHVYCGATNIITFRSKFSSADMDGKGWSRQSVKLFGSPNSTPVDGMITITNKPSAVWTGTGNVTLAMDSNGIVTVTLPTAASATYDDFLLMSPTKISSV